LSPSAIASSSLLSSKLRDVVDYGFDSSPDAELIELGAELDLIIAEWRGHLSDRENFAAINAVLERATGIAKKDAPEWSDNPEGCGALYRLA
jgi:hypothetical protein